MYISSVNTWTSGDSPLAQLVEELGLCLYLCVIQSPWILHSVSIHSSVSYSSFYVHSIHTGIFAILKSMECRDAINRGDAQMASIKSREAKRFGNITLGVGLAMLAVSVAFVVIYVIFVVTAVNH